MMDYRSVYRGRHFIWSALYIQLLSSRILISDTMASDFTAVCSINKSSKHMFIYLHTLLKITLI